MEENYGLKCDCCGWEIDSDFDMMCDETGIYCYSCFESKEVIS